MNDLYAQHILALQGFITIPDVLDEVVEEVRKEMIQVSRSGTALLRRFRKRKTWKEKAKLFAAHYEWILKHPNENEKIIGYWSNWCTKMLKGLQVKERTGQKLSPDEKLFQKICLNPDPNTW
jgi:hypothetical protein